LPDEVGIGPKRQVEPRDHRRHVHAHVHLLGVAARIEPGSAAIAAGRGGSPTSSARAAARAAWAADTAVHATSTACQHASAATSSTGSNAAVSMLAWPL
jgi:hypothetical protein